MIKLKTKLPQHARKSLFGFILVSTGRLTERAKTHFDLPLSKLKKKRKKNFKHFHLKISAASEAARSDAQNTFKKSKKVS